MKIVFPFRRIVVTFGALLTIPIASWAATWFVNVAQTNNPPTGLSWANASTNVQQAISGAVSNDAIWIASGIYRENLRLSNGISLYGGFVGNEVSLNQRDWFLNPTILDGRQSNTVITVVAGATNTTRIDGFVIRNGLANRGGGIFCSNASPAIINNVLTNNHGVGLFSFGGGIYLLSGSSPLIASNVIIFNTASVGGGVSCAGGRTKPWITKNRFENNKALTVSPGITISGDGGGGINSWVSANPLIEGNIFLKNIATNAAGSSEEGRGGGVCVASDATAVIINNTFLTNLATSSQGFPYLENGGGVYSASEFTPIANNIIAFGSSGIAGGSSANIYNNCVFGNGTNFLRRPDLTGTNGNISVNPLLVSSADFRLTSNSPCINAGSTNPVVSVDDKDGNPRIVGGAVDVGAYEYQSPQSRLSYAWLQQFGFPTDGSVDDTDPDGDEASNALEWVFNMNPTNAASVPAPVFVVHPASASYPSGIPVSLSAELVGAPPMTLQWTLNGIDVSSATESGFTIANFQSANAGTYHLRASNSFGVTFSSNAVLGVGQIAAWGSVKAAPLDATNLLAVAAGYDHVLWLTTNRTIRAWGLTLFDTYGETIVPAGLTNVVSIAAGEGSSFALREDMTVLAWGKQSAISVPWDLTNAVAVAAAVAIGGDQFAVRSDGAVRALGTLGSGDEYFLVLGLSNVVALAAGPNHNIVLRADGTVFAWGNNVFGAVAVPPGLSNVIAVAVGYSYSLALKSDGSVAVWGNASTVLNVPSGLSNVVAIASGSDHALALNANGTVVAWGRNDGGLTNVPLGLTNVIAISAGYDFSLALVGDGLPIQKASMIAPRFNSEGFAVTISSQSGQVFSLEHALEVNPTNWTRLPLVAGNGQDLTLTDSTATNSPSRFYRVRRW